MIGLAALRSKLLSDKHIVRFSVSNFSSMFIVRCQGLPFVDGITFRASVEMVWVVRRPTWNLIEWNGVCCIWEGHFVDLRPLSTDAELGQQQEKVSSELGRQNSVQVWIGTRVDGVEEDQQDFGLRYIDEWIPGQGSQAEKGDRGPAGKVREDLARKTSSLCKLYHSSSHSRAEPSS